MLDLEPIKAREAAATRGDALQYGDSSFFAVVIMDIRVLVAEVEQLREALAWYADQSNYDIAKWGWETPADVDSGHRARALLTAAEDKRDA